MSTASTCENSADVLEAYAIDEASSIVSVGKTATASSGVTNLNYLNDGAFNFSQTTAFGTLEDGPEWVAIDVGEGPSKLLLLFADAGYDTYTTLSGGAPVGYTIETSADSTDGEDGEWETVVEVTDNTVRNRAHSFDFEGKSWVRFTATEADEGRTTRLVELMLHDVSNTSGDRPQDSWLFFGDSIHQAAMRRALGRYSFENVVNDAHADFEPIMLNGSIGGETLDDALARIDSVIELNPDIQYFGIAYGTNDSWGNKSPEGASFREKLVELVETLLDAGRTPIIARIPYASEAHTTLPAFNTIIDDVTQEYDLPCGPDLYTWFLENPEQLGSDGVHPISQGDASINELWAGAASPLYVDE